MKGWKLEQYPKCESEAKVLIKLLQQKWFKKYG